VDAGVLRQFRMESRGHSSSLPHCDGICAFRGQDFDAFAYVRDFGGADEDHFEGRLMMVAFEIVKELAVADGAVDLTSVGVAADTDVEGAEPGLGGILYFLGEEDGAGAGAERRLEANELLELFESGFAKKFEEGAGFASGDDEAVDCVELLGLLDEHDICAELFEPAAVGVKIALQG